MRQRVGTGAKIWVQADPWLPSKFHPYITSPLVNGFEDVPVSALINPDSASWNTPLLQDLFLPRDIALIKSIPLSNKAVEDKLLWSFTHSGIFSVKLGYHFLCESQSFEDHSYQPDSEGIWKKVWALVVQPKIRNFLWQAIKDTILTKTNLKR